MYMFDKELRTATILFGNIISETKYRCRIERASFEKVILHYITIGKRMYVHVKIKNYGQRQYCMATKLSKQNIVVERKGLVLKR